jgi:magnesium chelatase family protein
VDTALKLSSFTIEGPPDAAVQESRERVRAAVKNASLAFPRQEPTVNLEPAALRKEGPANDLPIALGVGSAAGYLTDKVGLAGFLEEGLAWMTIRESGPHLRDLVGGP